MKNNAAISIQQINFSKEATETNGNKWIPRNALSPDACHLQQKNMLRTVNHL